VRPANSSSDELPSTSDATVGDNIILVLILRPLLGDPWCHVLP
jgi:hypothetical protein